MKQRNDIWDDEQNNGSKGLPEDLLLAYLEGKLTGDDLHRVEAYLSDEQTMESDAIEGLQQINTAEAAQITHQLQHNLRKSIKRKHRPQRRNSADNKWAWVAIFIIIMLGVLAFAYIKFFVPSAGQ